jgi:DNA polymerase-3 subunit delta'
MLFSKTIGNDYSKQILLKLIASYKIPHAMLFTGPSGVGKRQFALELAKGILGVEHSRKIDSGHHPDVRIFYPEGKTGMHPMASIQQLQEQMSLEPFEASSRVFIIDDADRMLATSSNALLKTLEEPEERNYLILLTHDPEAILSTIHSRCRKIPFFPIAEKELCHFVKTHFGKSDIDAKRIAFLSHGSLQKAMDLVDRPCDPKRELLIELLSAASFNATLHASLIIKLEQLIIDKTSDDYDPVKFQRDVDQILEEIFYWYRDLHILSLGASPDLVFHLDHLQLLQEKAKHKLPTLEFVGQLLEECRLAIQRSLKLKTTFEYLFSELAI